MTPSIISLAQVIAQEIAKLSPKRPPSVMVYVIAPSVPGLEQALSIELLGPLLAQPVGNTELTTVIVPVIGLMPVCRTPAAEVWFVVLVGLKVTAWP